MKTDFLLEKKRVNLGNNTLESGIKNDKQFAPK